MRVSWFSKEEILPRECKRLTELLEVGLPSTYSSWDEYWYDFYPDFSWNDHADIELGWCLEDPTWQRLAAELKAKHSVDFDARIRADQAERTIVA